MRRRLLARRPSPAMLVALTAVVLSLTGGAIAATIGSSDIERNAVKSKHIANGKVKSKDIRDNTIKTGKVRNGTLLAEDFRAGQLPKGDKGEPGQDGAAGPEGSAVAYAKIAADGNVDESASKGIEDADVTHTTGTYCLDADPGWKIATATVEATGLSNAAADRFASVGFRPSGSSPGWDGCTGNPTADIRITVWDVGSGLVDQPVMVWFED
jgi:hypothetical protein